MMNQHDREDPYDEFLRSVDIQKKNTLSLELRNHYYMWWKTGEITLNEARKIYGYPPVKGGDIYCYECNRR